MARGARSRIIWPLSFLVGGRPPIYPSSDATLDRQTYKRMTRCPPSHSLALTAVLSLRVYDHLFFPSFGVCMMCGCGEDERAVDRTGSF